MQAINISWLIALLAAAAWTVFFSMFNNPGIRGWRNLGWLACFIIGLVMLFKLPLSSSLGTWALVGVCSGGLYFAYETFAFARAPDRSKASRPRVATLLHGLLLWPIMLPEAIEYWLADIGVLKQPPSSPGPQT